MKNGIINELKFASKKKKNAVLGYVYCDYLLDMFEEIERLNNIINKFEDILKRDIKACNNKFENMFDRNYRRLILEEKLEQLQELKGGD